jgi:hypothetical protein
MRAGSTHSAGNIRVTYTFVSGKRFDGQFLVQLFVDS